MYLTNKNITFIHIPKNAGTCVKDFIKDFVKKSSGHFTINGIHPNKLSDCTDKENKNTFETFCVIRDPIDRFISQFFQRRATGRGIENKYSINEFIEKFLTNDFIQNLDVYFPQYVWIKNYDKIIADYIILFENLEEDLDYLNKKFFHSQRKILPKNKNKIREKVELSPESVRKIYQIYEIDFKIYEFCKDKKLNPQVRADLIKSNLII